jgi:hypothetical protein
MSEKRYTIRATSLGGSAVIQQGSLGYIYKYDPEAFGGRGDVEFTQKRKKAMTFGSHEEIHAFLHQQPKSRPLREDDLPNKPIFAFTLSIEPVEDKP